MTDPSEIDWLTVSLPLPEEGKIEPTVPLEDDTTATVLVSPTSRLDADNLLDRIRDLAIRQLRANGFHDLSTLFEVAVGDETSSTVNAEPQRWPTRRWAYLLLSTLLVASLAVLAYDRFIVQPNLSATRGGIFAFRDRVKATSDLSVPTLIGPEGEVEQLEPVLRVSDVPGALAYEFYVEDTVSGDGVYTGPLPNNAFPIPEGTLCPNTLYEWRVRVLGEDGWTSFSSALRFTVSPGALASSQQQLLDLARIKERPTPPVMVSPLGSVSSVTPTLEVEPAENVIGYGFYIRDLQTDQVIYNNNFALTNEVQLPEDSLKEGGIYQWNARARNCHYWSEFTPAQVFNVDVTKGD